MKKRGQAATEFLTTYGWAILILLIVIALIYALNIFNPKIKNSCIGSDPVDCSDVKFKATDSSSITRLDLVLTASGVSTDVGSETNVVSIKLTSPNPADCFSYSVSLQLPDGVQTTVSCFRWTPDFGVNNKLNQGTKFSGTATILYRLPGSVNSYTSKAIFSGTVE